MNSPWHLYRKCFVVSLDIDDFTFIAHVQKRQSAGFLRPEKCKRNNGTSGCHYIHGKISTMSSSTGSHLMIEHCWNDLYKKINVASTYTFLNWFNTTSLIDN